MSTILVVDDEPDLRFILRRSFERAGHEVITVGHGEDAWHATVANTPDLVVTDIMMPVMNGTELITQLRSEPATAHIPIIAVTGNPELSRGADALVAKPFRPAHLVAVAEKLLDRQEARP